MAYKCKSLSTVGFTTDGEAAALPLYCRKWQCPTCGAFHRKRLRRRLIAGQPSAFITLTVNPALHTTPDDAFRAASLAVNKLMKRIRRRFPLKRIEYALVWEKTKKGWPHAHLLVRAPWIPQSYLSQTWLRLTGAKIVDIRVVRSETEAAVYVSKYLTKDPAVPQGYRRYRTSENYSAAPPKGQLAALLGVNAWLRSNTDLPAALSHLETHGFHMVERLPDLWTSERLSLAQPPP